MLSLIGLGLFDEEDVNLRGISEAKSADKVYMETYTSNWSGNLQNLEKIIGQKISLLSRKDLEENSKKILDEARTKKVAIFIGGDPLVATTHSSLLLDAKKLGLETRVIHNTSIISAIAETGLHIYKFGATVTIPFLEKTKGILPESVYQTIAENKKLGLHTLCLLDIVDGVMNVSECLQLLLQIESKFKKRVFDENTQVVVYSLGSSPQIYFGKIFSLLQKKLSSSPAVVIIPGNLHFAESEFLNMYFVE